LYIKNEIQSVKDRSFIELGVLQNGHYAISVDELQRAFGENLMIIKNEDLNEKTSVVLETVSEFIGLKKINWSNLNEKKIFKGDYDEFPNNTATTLLKNYYKEYDRQLHALTGISYFN
jgi:hypothetical protein